MIPICLQIPKTFRIDHKEIEIFVRAIDENYTTSIFYRKIKFPDGLFCTGNSEINLTDFRTHEQQKAGVLNLESNEYSNIILVNWLGQLVREIPLEHINDFEKFGLPAGLYLQVFIDSQGKIVKQKKIMITSL